MDSALRLNIASDINRHHELACLRADEAINHAAEAGKLLLEVKAALKHGEWLPWLEENIFVSARQVQRYMQVAQGRPLPLRALVTKPKPQANAKPVSHLVVDAPRLFPGGPPVAEFVPEAGQCYAVILPDTTVFAVEPSLKHPGYFFVSKMDATTDVVDYTRRPVAAAWVEVNLQYFGLENPASAAWRTKPSAGVVEALGTFPECAA
ncbi:DUF3102 domain-containing protein [Variovorax sp. JS1663]|uniref:DUF3102 domain-containing protein n=1 Tax=Variovorax sp. JS1663 TaxID=1851577 RepID=UPI000B348FD4|nr:DUF3102 domain-containing protein [Variovorax sp. JS1663]OUM01653.1 hypothetical protein A8M77_15380 [Variovorax sp. JS1663]